MAARDASGVGGEGEGGWQALVARAEACTADDTEPAPPEVLAQLDEAAEGLRDDDAAQLAQWLSARLGTDSIPVVLKSLQLVGIMLDAAAAARNDALREALAVGCADAVSNAMAFEKLDPQHGERPSQLIRSTASGVSAKLGAAESDDDEAVVAEADMPEPEMGLDWDLAECGEEQVGWTPRSGVMVVEVPEGVEAGQLLLVTAPDGTDLEVAIPDGLVAGDTFRVAIESGDTPRSDLEPELELEPEPEHEHELEVELESESGECTSSAPPQLDCFPGMSLTDCL